MTTEIMREEERGKRRGQIPAEIYKLGLESPLLGRALYSFVRGECTYEQALELVVKTLISEKVLKLKEMETEGLKGYFIVNNGRIEKDKDGTIKYVVGEEI